MPLPKVLDFSSIGPTRRLGRPADVTEARVHSICLGNPVELDQNTITQCNQTIVYSAFSTVDIALYIAVPCAT